MNREEVDAKIAASDARGDAQIAAVIGRIDAHIARLEAFEREMREFKVEIKADIANLKKTVVVTGISAVLAIMFGMAGFNAALTSNMAASFQSGKEIGQWQSEIRKQAIETELVMTRVRKQLDATEALQKQINADLETIKQERASGKK